MDKQRRAASEKRRHTAAKAAAISGIQDKQTLQEIAPLLQFAAPRGMAFTLYYYTDTCYYLCCQHTRPVTTTQTPVSAADLPLADTLHTTIQPSVTFSDVNPPSTITQATSPDNQHTRFLIHTFATSTPTHTPPHITTATWHAITHTYSLPLTH